ncbi:MAG: hypothetical protein ABJR07_08740 [Lentilitoribacter sp.]
MNERRINQSISRSIDGSINQSINQSIDGLINDQSKGNQPTCWGTERAIRKHLGLKVRQKWSIY